MQQTGAQDSALSSHPDSRVRVVGRVLRGASAPALPRGLGRGTGARPAGHGWGFGGPGQPVSGQSRRLAAGQSETGGVVRSVCCLQVSGPDSGGCWVGAESASCSVEVGGWWLREGFPSLCGLGASVTSAEGAALALGASLQAPGGTDGPRWTGGQGAAWAGALWETHVPRGHHMCAASRERGHRALLSLTARKDAFPFTMTGHTTREAMLILKMGRC